MKKITLLLLVMSLMTFMVNAQITYTIVKFDGFETTDGFPSNFTKTASTAWSTAASPYTGGWWLGSFTDATTKTQVASISTMNPYSGLQCLKLDFTPASLSGTNMRFRSNTTVLNANIADWNNYIVTFYAKTETATSGQQLFKDNTELVTDQWKLFTFKTMYATSVNVQQISIDVLVNSTLASTGYTLYIDNFKVEKTIIPVTTAATDISQNSFKANWNKLVGANSYSLTVQQVLAGPTYTAVSGSPFPVLNDTSATVSGLSALSNYRYKITATDGTITTYDSNWTSVTTLDTPTSISDVKVSKSYVLNGAIYTTAKAGEKIELMNTVGQTIKSVIAVEGTNVISVESKGIVFVKVGNEVTKLIVK